MQERLKEVIESLGVAEKAVVEKNFLEKLTLWARLIDEVEAGLPFISDLNNTTSNFNQCKNQYEQIINTISGMNIAQDASRVTQVQNYYDNFRQYLAQLIDLKQKIQTLTEDTADITALKKVVADAKKQRVEFEKSFKENLEKQTTGSQRTLAEHFEKRLQELKSNDDTNPHKWMEKRVFWMRVIAGVLMAMIIVYVLLISCGWIKGYELTVAIVKAALIALLYLQYHFATKNYHIYADLVARYEHLKVISKTMTDFTAASFDNPSLNEAVYANAAKTLFGELSTGHLKQQPGDSSIIENFINQIPKAN